MSIQKIIDRQSGRDAMYNVWHSSRDAMLLWVHSGEGSIVFQSGVYPLRAGWLYYIGAEVPHYTLPGDGVEYIRSKIQFTPDVIPLEEQLRAFLAERQAVCAVPDAPAARRIDKLFFRLTQLKKEEPFAATQRLGILLQLLALLCASAGDSIELPRDPVAVAVSYINSHLESELTLDTLCTITRTSRSGLCHRFSRQMGRTMTEYIRSTRLERAVQLLRTAPQLSIAQVAERCGFGDAAWFCSVFRQHTGLSPGKYRRLFYNGEWTHPKSIAK